MTETKVLPSNLVNTFTMRTQKEIEQYLNTEIGEPLSNKEIEWYIDNAQNPIAIPKESVYRYLNNI